jgi:hypothetical protein
MANAFIRALPTPTAWLCSNSASRISSTSSIYFAPLTEPRHQLSSLASTRIDLPWETSIHPPSNTAAGDPVGGLMYRPLHRNAVTPDELFAQCLRQAFAVEFVTPTDTSALKESNSYAIDSLAQIFEHMEMLAISCAESTRTRAASIEISNGARALIATMEKLRALAEEPAWRRFSPVIHNLDWQLRMLPPQSAEDTFRAHADAYASATRVLQRTIRIARNMGEENETGAKGWSRRRFASTS